MARTARKPADEVEEIKTKDFAGAVKLYRHDIKKANSDAATSNQDASTAYKAIKKQCHIQPDAARKAFKLIDATEDAKRDDWLRGFVGLVNEMMGREVLTFHGTDLVDAMDSKPDRYARPTLVTLPDSKPSDGTETDLADSANFDEASPEELAQQEGRGTAPLGSLAAAAAPSA